MIRSFRSKALERFWWKGEARRVNAAHVERLRRQLGILDIAASPEAMNVPGWRFHNWGSGWPLGRLVGPELAADVRLE